MSIMLASCHMLHPILHASCDGQLIISRRYQDENSRSLCGMYVTSNIDESHCIIMLDLVFSLNELHIFKWLLGIKLESVKTG